MQRNSRDLEEIWNRPGVAQPNAVALWKINEDTLEVETNGAGRRWGPCVAHIAAGRRMQRMIERFRKYKSQMSFTLMKGFRQ